MRVKVDENMRRAHERDAATKGKFFFRSNLDFAADDNTAGKGQAEEELNSDKEGRQGECAAGDGGHVVREAYSPCDFDPQSDVEEMTVREILEGKVRGMVDVRVRECPKFGGRIKISRSNSAIGQAVCYRTCLLDRSTHYFFIRSGRRIFRVS